MARPYRVWRLDAHRGEIHTGHERWYTTQPISLTRVFPRFEGGTRYLRRSELGFVAEVEMQVSEKLVGFVERRGSKREQHDYKPGSPYSQKPLTRFFETTGACWSFPSLTRTSDETAHKLLEAFALKFGIQERDLGIGIFSARPSPLGAEQIHGLCIYDTTAGSLRLTQRLAEHFAETLAAACESVDADAEPDVAQQLAVLSEAAATLEASVEPLTGVDIPADDDDWLILIAPGEQAILMNASGSQEVDVADFRYTPKGMVYELRHRTNGVTWTAPEVTVQPVYGETKMVRYNVMTGERIEL
jgi:DEAD/DEAH box helicase domain-containing protein